MFEIIENVKLEMDNVLSFKGEITQQEMVYVMKEIEQVIAESTAQKNGSIVTATFGMRKNDGQLVANMEILVPLNKVINPPSGYTFKPVFRLNNAVKVRHYGNPSMLQESADELMKYIIDSNLTPITVGYNITVREPKNKGIFDDSVIDIYIGVCDNIL